MTARIAILDYGMGNLRSVEKALGHIGAAATITKGAAHKPLPAEVSDKALARLDHFRNAKGSLRVAHLRLEMQKVINSVVSYLQNQDLPEKVFIEAQNWVKNPFN